MAKVILRDRETFIHARWERGYRKVEQLAAAAGCSYRTIYRLEKGEPVSESTASTIAEALYGKRDWRRRMAEVFEVSDAA